MADEDMTPLERAQEIASMDPLPEDYEERIAALEEIAVGVDKARFAWIWEAVALKEPVLRRLPGEIG